MNLIFLLAKIAVVTLFLVMFLRSNKVYWGIGLITVTTAILLDTFLGTFGREEMLEQLGFFYYILIGALIAGAAIWLWGILKPYIQRETKEEYEEDIPVLTDVKNAASETSTAPLPEVSGEQSADREVATDAMRAQSGETDEEIKLRQICGDLTQEQLLDVIFDMGYYADLVTEDHADAHGLISKLLTAVEDDERLDELTLACERVDSPIPAEHLPRLEKIQTNSPRTILRQYIIANYSEAQMVELSKNLGVHWTSLSGDTTRAKARDFLAAVEGSGDIETLITEMRVIGEQER